MRYIAELERKVQTLQTEATSLSVQLTLLQVILVNLENFAQEAEFQITLQLSIGHTIRSLDFIAFAINSI